MFWPSHLFQNFPQFVAFIFIANGWAFGCFYILVIVNNAAINIHVQVFLWTYIVTSLGYVSSSGITGYMVAAAKLLQLCLTHSDPIDGSPPGPLSLGFSKQEYWSVLPFPPPMHESEK